MRVAEAIPAQLHLRVQPVTTMVLLVVIRIISDEGQNICIVDHPPDKSLPNS